MRDNVMQSTAGNNPLQVICGAKTRTGHPCRTPPVTGRKRCRMHGGTNNGAPKGNTKAHKHGYYSKANVAARSETHKMIREYRKLCKGLDLINH
jgi:hypothetical protein